MNNRSDNMTQAISRKSTLSVGMASVNNTRRFLAGLGSLALFAGLLVALPQANAQIGSGYNQQNYAQGSVVMYSECGFQGTARTVGVGEHSKIANLRFPNDQMSSIRVPAGFEVTIYEDHKFRGAFARLTQDISCFDQSWNNTVSSIKVAGNPNVFNQGFPQPAVNQQLVTVGNLASVNFATSQLRKLNNRTWGLSNSQFGGQTNYNVVSQDASSVFMQSTVSAERLRVDLAANRVTYYAANGQAQDFPILRKQAGASSGNNPGFVNDSNRGISGPCFTYKAYARGGNASLRFEGKDIREQFNNSPVSGRICHSGRLNMEVAKTSPNTEVVVEIQGKQFAFRANEKEDLFRNNWYRKKRTTRCFALTH